VLPRSDRRARFAASPARSRYGFAHSSCGASAQSQQRRYGAGCPAAVGRARQRPLRIRVHAGCGWAGTTSATIVVPDVPDLAEAASARLPMTAGRPVLVANRLAASIFGPIDPGGSTAGRHRKLPHAEGVSTISRSSCQPSAELIQEGGAASGNRTPDPRITNAPDTSKRVRSPATSALSQRHVGTPCTPGTTGSSRSVHEPVHEGDHRRRHGHCRVVFPLDQDCYRISSSDPSDSAGAVAHLPGSFGSDSDPMTADMTSAPLRPSGPRHRGELPGRRLPPQPILSPSRARQARDFTTSRP